MEGESSGLRKAQKRHRALVGCDKKKAQEGQRGSKKLLKKDTKAPDGCDKWDSQDTRMHIWFTHVVLEPASFTQAKQLPCVAWDGRLWCNCNAP